MHTCVSYFRGFNVKAKKSYPFTGVTTGKLISLKMYITTNKPNGTFYDCENLLGLRTCFSFRSSTDLMYVNGLYQNRVFVPVIDRESISLIVSNSAKEFILCGEDFIFSLYCKIFDWHKL